LESIGKQQAGRLIQPEEHDGERNPVTTAYLLLMLPLVAMMITAAVALYLEAIRPHFSEFTSCP